MDYQTRKVYKLIAAIKEDLNMAIKRIECINKDACDDKTNRIIDNAFECIDMANQFLDKIELSEYGVNFNGENIILK